MVARRPAPPRPAAGLAQRVHAGARRFPPMLGARPHELASMATLAMVAGDWATAVVAARERLRRRPDDEGALVALGVGLWELGREGEAHAALRPGDHPRPSRARAAVRFHHYRDDPAAAERALGKLTPPPADLAVGVADVWRRHGDFGRALAVLERLLAVDASHARACALRRHALAEQRVLDGTWSPPASTAPLEPRAGCVLHLLERSLPQRQSGSTVRTEYTIRAQAAAGLQPEVVTQPGFAWPGGSTARDAVDLRSGIRHHRLPSTAAPGAPLDERLRDYLQGAARVVERVRPAVLHPASDYVNALVALELGRRFALPVVYEVRGFPELGRGRWAGSRASYEKALWRTALEADCRRAADRVVTLADVMRERIVAGGVDPARVEVLPNAVDAERFRPVTPDPGLRARLGIPEGELVLGYVSMLNVLEGLPTLLEAAARLVTHGRPVRVLLVGDGHERAFLRQLARRLGIGDRVVLTGRVSHEDVLAHLALIDVFVAPRLDVDDFGVVTPLKPYEAMAAGKAVVASDVPALREMVREGETGELFRSGDAEDLARVLARLADDPARRRELGRRARDWVRRERTWAANAERYRRLYCELSTR